jgi:hypothetical protein
MGQWWLTRDPRHNGAVPLPVITSGYLMEKGDGGERKRTLVGKFTLGEARMPVKLHLAVAGCGQERRLGLTGGIQGKLEKRARIAWVGALRRGE